MEDVVLRHERPHAPHDSGEVPGGDFRSNIFARREATADGVTLYVVAACLPSVVPRAGDRFHGRDILTVRTVSLTPRDGYVCACDAGS